MRAAMPSVTIGSSGVPATLSAPTPVVPPAIACASAGSDDRAEENFPASKRMLVPSLLSWRPTVTGDQFFVVPGGGASDGVGDLGRDWAGEVVQVRVPLRRASLPSL